MNRIFTILLLLLNFACFSNNNVWSDYKNHIAGDRLIVIFEKGTGYERKETIINGSGFVSSHTNLPSPSLTICFTTNREAATKYFAQIPEVKFVSFFITDGTHYAGVLDDFFVKLKDKNFEPLLSEMLQQKHLPAFTRDAYIPNLYKIHATKAETQNMIDLCAEFEAQGWCNYATPNYLFNPLVTTNDPYYSRQWNIENTGSSLQYNGTPDADMDVDSAWTITTGDSTIKISIIDSGVDTLQPDLMANLLAGHDAVSDSNKTDGYPTPNYAEDGHGTCCAGIVAAVKDNNKDITGVAPSCKIIPVHTFYYIVLGTGSTPIPYSTAAAFADAIGWSWDTAGADILSNSWGLPAALIPLLPGGTQPVTDAIQTAYANGRGGKGIAMFFSSGNDNDSIGPIWPGSLPQTIAVNATTMCDTRKYPGDCSGASENWGGDFGPGLDFGAPGVRIPTTDMRGTKGFSTTDYYLLFNGTSAACPNAAAVGALVLSLRPDLDAEGVRNVIARTCEKVGGYNYDSTFVNGTWCHELGYGRVNAYYALQYATQYSAINEPVNVDLQIKVFPNPAKNILNVAVNEEGAVMQLYNITGQLLLQTKTVNGINTIDTSPYGMGVYVLKLHTAQGDATRKITLTR